ncbi:MAG: hypothetical protein V7K40_20275 [Nostoc sp.]|uniref:hypothetical protein n=1 Tax=Nostoc sp. TaxID=1180 RepID=UPI002FF8990C
MPGQLLQRGELPQRTGFSAKGCALSERKSVSKSCYAAGFTRRCVLAEALVEMVVACGKPLRVYDKLSFLAIFG